MMIRVSVAAIVTVCVLFVSASSAQKKKETDKGIELDPSKIRSQPAKKKPSYSQSVKGTLKQFDRTSKKNFTLEVKVVDPRKVLELENWKAQTLRGIAGERNFANRQRRLNQFRIDLAKRQQGIYVGKDVELQATDDIIVRSMFMPLQYDDKGNPKQWTKKELRALWQKDKLPAYPADYGVLEKGQSIQVYIASKSKTKKKGIPGITEPENPIVAPRPQVVMIVVLGRAQ